MFGFTTDARTKSTFSWSIGIGTVSRCLLWWCRWLYPFSVVSFNHTWSPKENGILFAKRKLRWIYQKLVSTAQNTSDERSPIIHEESVRSCETGQLIKEVRSRSLAKKEKMVQWKERKRQCTCKTSINYGQCQPELSGLVTKKSCTQNEVRFVHI